MKDDDSSTLSSPPDLRAPPGWLVVDVVYGNHKHHHSEGPMGLYPHGVNFIIEAVMKAFAEHDRLTAALEEK